MPTDSYYAEKLARLTDQSLAPSDFSHSDHIGVACQALMDNDFFRACTVIGDGIRALAVRGGEAEKYNVTITFIFMSIVGERLAANKHDDIADFIAKNPELSQRSLIASVYSTDRLSEPTARNVALLPVSAYGQG